MATSRAIPYLTIQPDKHYRVRARLSVPFSQPTHTVLIQAGKYGRWGADLRIEYNPSKVGLIGQQEINSLLQKMIAEPGSMFFQQAKITRIDLAIDIPGLSLREAVVRSKRARKHLVCTGTTGLPETVYLGGARSNRTVAYDKELPDDSDPVLRIERRLKPLILLPGIVSIPNPFADVSLVATAALVPLITELHPDLFFDSVRVRGFERSMHFLSPGQRGRIRQVMKDQSASLMPPIAELWLSWPQVLKTTGLSTLLSLT